MNNCAFIQSNGIEFRLPIERNDENPFVAIVSGKMLWLPHGIIYDQVEEITIYAGTQNLTKIIYYIDGNQDNKDESNRIGIYCTMNGALSESQYSLKQL